MAQKKSDTVTMTKAEMLKEHVRLVKILRTGTKLERMKEAAKQSKEMQEYK